MHMKRDKCGQVSISEVASSITTMVRCMEAMGQSIRCLEQRLVKQCLKPPCNGTNRPCSVHLMLKLQLNIFSACSASHVERMGPVASKAAIQLKCERSVHRSVP
eukprot:4214797-Amphidinium_carterae.1